MKTLLVSLAVSGMAFGQFPNVFISAPGGSHAAFRPSTDAHSCEVWLESAIWDQAAVVYANPSDESFIIAHDQKILRMSEVSSYHHVSNGITYISTTLDLRPKDIISFCQYPSNVRAWPSKYLVDISDVNHDVHTFMANDEPVKKCRKIGTVYDFGTKKCVIDSTPPRPDPFEKQLQELSERMHANEKAMEADIQAQKRAIDQSLQALIKESMTPAAITYEFEFTNYTVRIGMTNETGGQDYYDWRNPNYPNGAATWSKNYLLPKGTSAFLSIYGSGSGTVTGSIKRDGDVLKTQKSSGDPPNVGFSKYIE
jgi:hypothetical protein